MIPAVLTPAALSVAALSVAALALLQPVAAAAQIVTQPAGVEVDTARVFGDDAPRATGTAVQVADGFSITAGLLSEYSDNIARLNDQLPIPPSYESRADFRFRPTVSLAVGRQLGRQRVFANVDLGRDFYVRNTILDSNRFLIDGGLDWSAGSRCGGRVQGGYEDRATRFDQFSVVVPSKQKTVTFFASASCRSPVGISPNISYDYAKVTNSVTSDNPLLDQLRQIADVTSSGLSGGLTYGLAGRGNVGVQGSWRTSKFPNQVINGQEAGTEILALQGVVDYRIGPSLQVNAGLGYNWVNSQLEAGTDYSGVTYEGSLVYSGPRLGATLSFSRGVTGSTGGLANYSLVTDFQVGVSYRTNDRLGLNAGFSRSDVDSRGLDDIPINLVQQDYALNRFFVGANYQLNRRFSAGLDYSHEKRASDPDVFSYSANTISLSLKASF